MFAFDDEQFLDGYRRRFGPLNDQLAQALRFLIGRIEQDASFSSNPVHRNQIAYCLATFKWETAHTLRPIDEFGDDARFNRLYGPDTRIGKMLGNTKAGDGARFHGRGYVQLTGRANYDRAGKLLGVDLIGKPEDAKKPEVAYAIAMEGMKKGWFTGKKLDNYFKSGQLPNYEEARRIINGQDKAQTIADIARRFDELLVNALE
ncbi:MAG: glycoside hydrolase family 19 protein [Lysobacter sp.]